jgi:hypothetical protein
MKYKEEIQAYKTISEELKNFDIIKKIFDELRVSERIEFGITGAECDCWMYCECHNQNTCLNKKELCSDGHDHSFDDCDNNCGIECSCECTHTEQIVLTSSIKFYTSDYGRWDEINPVEFADIYEVYYSCSSCRRGCYRCKWINDILKISDLSDDIIKNVEYTAGVLASDAFNAGERYSEDPEADDYITALALDGFIIDINKNIQS